MNRIECKYNFRTLNRMELRSPYGDMPLLVQRLNLTDTESEDEKTAL